MTHFVHREAGSIVWAGGYQQPGYADEALPDNDPGLVAFLTPAPAAVALAQLQQKDAEMSRLLEALADVLLTKGVIVPGDFRADIRALYQQRKALRAAAGVP